jgi:hypothetical protein
MAAIQEQFPRFTGSMRKAPAFQLGDISVHRIYSVLRAFNRCFNKVKINSFTTAV